MHIQNTLIATQHESYWLTQGEANLIVSQFGAFYFALATSWRR
jgi:hypothetical protein